MPDRNPESWTALLLVLLSDHRYTLVGALAAVVMSTVSAVRAGGRFSKSVLGGVMCGLLAMGLINVMDLVGIPPEKSLFIGVVIGSIGADNLREWVIAVARKWLQKMGWM